MYDAMRNDALLGLATDHEVHGREQVLLSTGDQAVGGQRQTGGRLLGTSGGQLDRLKDTGEFVDAPTSPVRHTRNGEEVVHGLDVLHVTRQGPVPGEGVVADGHVLVAEKLKASGLHGGEGLLDPAHVGDTITLLDAETNLTVSEVVVVVVLGHEPLVDTESTTGLEHTVNLAVDALEGGGVDGSLNGVDGVEAVVLEGHLHEVALDEVELLGQTLLGSVGGGAVDLVVVVVEASDVGARELGNLTRRATDTAANVQDPHALLDVHRVGEVVLVAGNGLVEGLAVGEATEVEGLAPAVLVQIGRKVVVVLRKGGVLGGSCLLEWLLAAFLLVSPHSGEAVTYSAGLLGLLLGTLVVPVLEVLVDSGLLGVVALGEHGGEATSRIGRLAVHGLVEGGIAVVVLALEVGHGGRGDHFAVIVGVPGVEGTVEKELRSVEYGVENGGGGQWQRAEARLLFWPSWIEQRLANLQFPRPFSPPLETRSITGAASPDTVLVPDCSAPSSRRCGLTRIRTRIRLFRLHVKCELPLHPNRGLGEILSRWNILIDKEFLPLRLLR